MFRGGGGGVVCLFLWVFCCCCGCFVHVFVCVFSFVVVFVCVCCCVFVGFLLWLYRFFVLFLCLIYVEFRWGGGVVGYCVLWSVTTGKTDILMTIHSLWISQFGFSRLLQFWVCKRREFPVDGECQPIQSRGVLNGVNNFCKTNNNRAIRT